MPTFYPCATYPMKRDVSIG